MEVTLVNNKDLKKIQNLPIITRSDSQKKLGEKEEKVLREMNDYEFMNLEEPGLMQKFTYGNATNKHTFIFLHGGKYKVPRFIARHIESKSTPMWGWKPDGSGSMAKYQKGTKSRFQMREVYD